MLDSSVSAGMLNCGSVFEVFLQDVVRNENLDVQILCLKKCWLLGENESLTSS